MDLLIELQCRIIIEAGGFSLLKNISSKIRYLYRGDISRYNNLRNPVSPNEINEYLKNRPLQLWIINNSSVSRKYIHQLNHNYNYKPHTAILCRNNGIDIGPAGLTHCRYESDTELITNNKVQHYDIKTTYNVLLSRHQPNLVKMACLDIFNHYCNILTGECLKVYLYINICMFDNELFIDQIEYLNTIETYNNIVEYITNL